MKKENLKCVNCGSSDFNQIADNLFECVYCSAKVKNDSSVKDDFIYDLKEEKLRRSIKYMKVNIGEDEFYKKALAHLYVNKHLPTDLLTKGKFGFVKYEYKFFAVIDAVFTCMKVKAKKENIVNLTVRQQINNQLGKLICIELSDGIDNKYMDDVLEYIEDIVYNHRGVSSDWYKDNIINLPSKEIIDEKIANCIENYKKKLLSLHRASNHVVHKICKIDIIGMPIYSLDFEYGGKQYQISSSAHKLNFTGNIPNEKIVDKQVNKLVLPVNIVSIILSVGAAIFAILHLTNRLLGLVKFNLIFAGISVLGFAVSWIINKIVFKKISKRVYQQKMDNLNAFLKKNNKKLSQQDKKYIEKFLRWF